MGQGKDLLENKSRLSVDPYPDILKALTDASELCAGIFPNIEQKRIDEMLLLCARNQGLVLSPRVKPEFLFAYFRYWPQLVDAVEHWDMLTLPFCSLRDGPILHIAALITATTRAYALTRELIGILNPLGVSCHRYKNGEYNFHFKRNPRFSGELRLKNVCH